MRRRRLNFGTDRRQPGLHGVPGIGRLLECGSCTFGIAPAFQELTDGHPSIGSLRVRSVDGGAEGGSRSVEVVLIS